MNIDSVEKICEIRDAYDAIELKVKEVGEYLGFLNHQWVFESFEIGKTSIILTAYDYYYDLHDTSCLSFPLECLVSKDFLENYRVQMIKDKEEEERKKKEAEEIRLRHKELAELERLSKKYGK